MIAMGCDVGSLTAKAVVMDGEKILGWAVVRAKRVPEESAREVMARALERAGCAAGDVAYCVGTGYGRKHISFAQGVESEIVCHAKGAVWQAPAARTVIDIGGQDAKAIRVDAGGAVVRYVYNDKCASGTGRFLEVIAEALDVKLEEMGEIAARSRNHISLSNQCVVFAETEIISLVNEGAEIPDIINALHHAVANRAVALARGIGIEGDTVFTGGVAHNPGMFTALGRALGRELTRIENPQINGAVGAALFALEAASAPGARERERAR